MAYPSLYHRLVANTHEPENGQACWCWKGKRDRWGYGRFNVREAGEVRIKMAHVEMARMVHGVPAGHHVDHLCRNPSCVNPDHLEPVTPSENMKRRSAAKGFSRDSHV